MLLLVAESVSSNSFAIPALVTGVAALISPVLALGRWLQEKSIKHKYLDEMRRCGELLEFIRRYPEITSTISATELSVLEKARAELGQCLGQVDTLLDAKVVKASPPIEMAWPRRLLLLYAPRTWAATLLHAFYNLIAVLSLLALFALGFTDESDAFQWSEYVRVFQNPLFLSGICFWLFVFFLLWYIANTKDRWDNTLPLRREQGERHFLRDTPDSVRDLLARVLLAYSTFDLIFPLAVRGPVKHALMSNASVTSILSTLPETKLWEKVAAWVAYLACPALAYLWTEAEFVSRGKRHWLAFPHNFRFFYPPKGWKETFAQFSLFLFSLRVILLIAGLREGFLVASRIAPKDDAAAFLSGVLAAPAVDIIFLGILPIYASYRLGLNAYFLRTPSA